MKYDDIKLGQRVAVDAGTVGGGNVYYAGTVTKLDRPAVEVRCTHTLDRDKFEWVAVDRMVTWRGHPGKVDPLNIKTGGK